MSLPNPEIPATGYLPIGGHVWKMERMKRGEQHFAMLTEFCDCRIIPKGKPIGPEHFRGQMMLSWEKTLQLIIVAGGIHEDFEKSDT